MLSSEMTRWFLFILVCIFHCAAVTQNVTLDTNNSATTNQMFTSSPSYYYTNGSDIQTTVASTSQSQGLVDLFIAGLLPKTGVWHAGDTMLIAAQLAMEDINGRDDILPGYRLNLIYGDTKVYILFYF